MMAWRKWFAGRRRVAMPVFSVRDGLRVTSGIDGGELPPLTAVAPLACRTKGAVARRFTGAVLLEVSMNLTACGLELLRATRGLGATVLPARRAVARQVRVLRGMNERLG
jgi:hypothetical protein